MLSRNRPWFAPSEVSMNMFDRANQPLRTDLEAYAQALSAIVAMLPQARTLCDQIVKEVRLAEALLAFGNNQQLAELSQLAFQLTNLWPYREQSFVRTFGFEQEIEETRQQRAEALRGVLILTQMKDNPLAAEVRTCFANIAQLLEDQHALLAEGNALIKPHATNMDMTRKRLTLLAAMVDVRVPDSLQQAQMLRIYNDVLTLLHDWESGVPMDEHGVALIEQCLGMLTHIDHMLTTNEEATVIYLIPGAFRTTQYQRLSSESVQHLVGVEAEIRITRLRVTLTR
jgi:hypothetical protein